MTHLDKVLYTGQDPQHGRPGWRRLPHFCGHLDVKLSTPGTSGIGTNPEQLFAVPLVGLLRKSDRACGPQKKSRLPADVAIDAEVDLNLADGGYFLRTRLTLPGVEREAAEALVDEARDLSVLKSDTRQH
jgi:lipoyl-dependent peroxiredoxin